MEKQIFYGLILFLILFFTNPKSIFFKFVFISVIVFFLTKKDLRHMAILLVIFFFVKWIYYRNLDEDDEKKEEFLNPVEKPLAYVQSDEGALINDLNPILSFKDKDELINKIPAELGDKIRPMDIKEPKTVSNLFLEIRNNVKNVEPVYSVSTLGKRMGMNNI